MLACISVVFFPSQGKLRDAFNILLAAGQSILKIFTPLAQSILKHLGFTQEDVSDLASKFPWTPRSCPAIVEKSEGKQPAFRKNPSSIQRNEGMAF